MDQVVADALANGESASGPRTDPTDGPPPAGCLLSAREREVLRLVADGLPDRDIADVLFLSRRTVNSHVASALHKLDVPSRAAAVALAVRRGLL